MSTAKGKSKDGRFFPEFSTSAAAQDIRQTYFTKHAYTKNIFEKLNNAKPEKLISDMINEQPPKMSMPKKIGIGFVDILTLVTAPLYRPIIHLAKALLNLLLLLAIIALALTIIVPVILIAHDISNRNNKEPSSVTLKSLHFAKDRFAGALMHFGMALLSPFLSTAQIVSRPIGTIKSQTKETQINNHGDDVNPNLYSPSLFE
jgi:hypothetical protein